MCQGRPWFTRHDPLVPPCGPSVTHAHARSCSRPPPPDSPLGLLLCHSLGDLTRLGDVSDSTHAGAAVIVMFGL